jgi:NDP-sugar pyrophosphorylase family protein
MNPEDYQVVVVAGGYGKGLMHRTQNKIPKCLLKVGKENLLDYCLELYMENGFEDFVFLLGYLAEKIVEHVKSNYKINARFSIEEKPLGKGGAIKYALDKGVIDKNKPSLITYPDDVILQKDFPKKFIEYHEKKREEGAIATVACVPKVKLRYGFFEVDEKNFARNFEEKPWIEGKISVGTYVLEPETYKLFDFELKEPVDFESTIVKKICEMGKLACFVTDSESWISFNDEKDFEEGEKKLTKLF